MGLRMVMLTRLASALGLVVLLTAACGKGTAPPPDATGTAANLSEREGNPGPIGVAGAGATSGRAHGSAVPTEAELNAALEQLTQALRKYSFERRRLPKTLGEVVTAGYVTEIPQAPPGQVFAINPKTMQVVLVKE
jgi:hypothetical protein